MSGFFNVPGGTGVSGSYGNFHWKGPVADFAALPASDNSDGDVRVTLDDHSGWIWDGGNWVAFSGGGGGGANTSLSNLSSVAFNYDLIPDADGDYNVGSSSIQLDRLYTYSVRSDQGNLNLYTTNNIGIIASSGQMNVYCQDDYGGLHVIGDSGGEASVSLHPDNIANGNIGQWVLYTGGNNTGSPYDFSIFNSGSSDAFVIQASDNFIGINTYTPQERLDVNGAINSSSYITVPHVSTVSGDLTLDSDSGNIDFGNSQLLQAGSLAFTGTAASAGVIRIPNNDLINWRNIADDDDFGIKLNNQDHLDVNTSLEINNGHLFQAENKTIVDSSGFNTYNVSQNGATFSSPITNAAIIFNTLNNTVHADDDFTSLYGFGSIGLASSISAEVALTKTIDLLTSVAASVQIGASSTGGTLTNAVNFSAAGIYNSGGTLTIDNCVAFLISSNNGSGVTNAWGIRDDSAVENSLNRLAINTTTQKVSAGTVGLEVEDKDILVTGTGNVRIEGNLGVGNSAAGSTPGSVVKKIEIFDASGSSLGFIAVYDSIT